MAFTELYAQTTGSNLNSGSTTADAAVYTCTNSNWDGTSVFTPTDGTTPASTVSVGDFASVYLDAATVAVYVARVTVVAAGVNGAITLSTTAKSGTAPATGATGRTIKVGGAWKGPNAAVAHPFGFVQSTMTNAAGDFPRINIKNGTTYSITAAMTHANAGPIRWQGYTSAAGDGGKAIIDGGTSGASYSLLTNSVSNVDYEDIIFQNNGASGSAAGLTISAAENTLRRVVVNSVRGVGFQCNAAVSILVECEAYACNQSNTASLAGFNMPTAGTMAIRCISHDNAGSNSAGFILGSAVTCISCIADTNGGIGFSVTSVVTASMIGCDSYNNTSDGIRLGNTTAASFYIENCNPVKNGGWGINGSGAGTRNGLIVNCAFGVGTQVNTSGTTTGLSAMVETGSVSYATGVTPWVDPANGDFRINLAAARGAGRGTFTQTAASYAGTIAYPDIGAGQSLTTTIVSAADIAAIADAVWDEARSGHTTSGTFGEYVPANVTNWLGTAPSTPTVAGVPNVNVKTWNDLTTVALPLIPTTAGRTLDVSTTGESGLDFDNIKDATGAHTLTNIRVPNVTLTDTVTTYTGNTLQTGDSFARIGATGSGLTSLAPSATALSTVNWTTARAGYLDNVNNAALQTTAAQTGDAYAQTNSGTFGLAAIKGYVDDIGVAGAGLTALGDTRLANLDAAVSTRMATYTQPTGFLAATFPAGTVANTTNITAGVITTVTSVTNAVVLPTIPADWITASGIATDAFGALELAAGAASEIATAVRTELATELARIDVAISTRGTGTGTALDAAGVRNAVGLGSANLDTQLDALPTNAELATALGTADDAVLAAIAALNNITVAAVAAQVTTDHGAGSYIRNTEPVDVSANVTAIKAKTDNLPSDPADASDIAGAFSTVNATLGVIAGYIDTEVAAILAAVDTEVAAIKAKTDLIPASPASSTDVSVVMTTQMTESYAADGVAPTPAQALFLMQQRLTEFVITGTSIVVNKLDGTTQAAVLTLDSPSPTSSTRSA